MNSVSRKNILKAAKDGIKKELIEKLDQIKSELEKEWQKECDDRDTEKIDLLLERSSKITEEYNSFGKSKRAKKKAAIQWAEDSAGNKVEKPKKAHREVKDWDAIRQIRANHVNSRPRASAWLQEGGMVVQRGSSMPMMVLSIRSNGIVQVLAGGMTKNLRDISLRPAFDEE
tara:strand:- start:423 stop:938 length:516 start_codon:yes stop_codon:yes gene_type:complete